MESGPSESAEWPTDARPTRLPILTWAFIIWILLVVARAISTGGASLARGRLVGGATQLGIGAIFAWGIFLLFQRRVGARTFWLIVLGACGALLAVVAVLTTGEKRDLALATTLWLAAWALYFARSHRLKAALGGKGQYAAPAV